ncbi:unnamed protein product [Cylicocyclus nassatus]|uniref:Uncharacterized protein n=1 Tax=Cylicocyclus nassatus TaxID=53992 RepID=A0AA36GV72_CYLNA|nr:unnamed protein product [Cylicocyclus nassatus]
MSLFALQPLVAADRCPLPEPKADFVVDLSKSEVSDKEKEQLQALFYEFRDRISQSSYDLGLPGEAMEGDSTVTPTPAAGMEQLTAPTHVPLTSEPREMEALMPTSSTSAERESSSTSDLGVPAREEHYSEWLWLEDRLDQFDSYIRDPRAAKKRMAHLFRVACSALAAAESSTEEP